MSPSSSASKLVSSIIGDGLTITGNVRAKGEVQIDGHIEGDVRCSSLLLSESSQVIGNVVAEDVVVRGKVVGGIKALRVTLHNNCYVEGDIHHQSLAIEQGAYFEGRSRHSDEPLGEIEDAQPRLDAGKAKELGDALDADRHESRITPAYEQSERLIIEPAEDFPAREPSTGDEEAEGEAALRH
jgi:cytoskeletal protein CcmA (bactofilin family)